MTDGTDNRRQVARIPIQLRVEYRRMNSFLAEYTKNISRGGTFVRTDRPLPPGSRFRFQLCVPGGAAPFELTGEVAWAETGGPEPGMGVRFVWRGPEERDAFEAAVERLLDEQLGPVEAARVIGGKRR